VTSNLTTSGEKGCRRTESHDLCGVSSTEHSERTMHGDRFTDTSTVWMK
jgi:hypothetical protein